MYLSDLSRNPLVINRSIWKQFIGDIESRKESPEKLGSNIISQISSPLKENLLNISYSKPSQKSPEEFLKIWNERNQRQKEMSYQKGKKNK